MNRILQTALIVGISVGFLVAVNRTAQKSEKGAQELRTLEEFKKVCTQDKPAILLFYAPWCGVCTRIKEPFTTVAQKHPEVHMARINIDTKALKEIVEAFNVTAVPTIVARNVGFMSTDQLSQLAKSMTPPAASPKKWRPS